MKNSLKSLCSGLNKNFVFKNFKFMLYLFSNQLNFISFSEKYNKYFSLRFGLVNAIDTCLRLKICVVWLGIFNPKYILIEFTIPNPSLIYFCISEIFKRLFCRLKLVLNVGIKAF